MFDTNERYQSTINWNLLSSINLFHNKFDFKMYCVCSVPMQLQLGTDLDMTRSLGSFLTPKALAHHIAEY